MSSQTSNPISDFQRAQQIAAVSPVSLTDVNWSVRLVHSSSKSDNLKEPRVILQLRLLDKTNDEQNRWVTLELTEAELTEFISKLQQTSDLMHTISK